MAKKINKNQLKAQEAWNVPQYSPAWADYDANEWYGVRFMKDSLGFVQFKGLVKNVSGSTQGVSQLLLLPVGYRPVHRIRFLCASAATGGSTQVDILPNGQVFQNSSIPNAEWVSLSNVRFLADGA